MYSPPPGLLLTCVQPLTLFCLRRRSWCPSSQQFNERRIRPLIVAREISGGTRSPKGSQARMELARLFGTWMAQRLNPFHQCLAILTLTSSLDQN